MSNLIDRLNSHMGKQDVAILLADAREAATLLEEAREAFRAIVDGDVPRPLGQIYRQDKRRSKHDLCIHRVPMHDDCGNCTGDFANAMLAKLDGTATVAQPPQGV